MINNVLEIHFSGWTATPRMPFLLSGNSVCMPTPSYSLLLGLIGCCLGRVVEPGEVRIGFKYQFDSISNDLETRQRLEYDGKRIKIHSKGTDAYLREFHVAPKLIVWIDRLDWEHFFLCPVGTPSLGRSQDILRIDLVKKVEVANIPEATISGCLLPFQPGLNVGGQLIQMAEAYIESEEVGSGRVPTRSIVFISLHQDHNALVKMNSLYCTKEAVSQSFYLHEFLR